MLEVLNVSKHFGSVRAVSELSFTAQPAKIFGLLGPNGAGKTTTIRMVLDIFQPDSGEVKWRGERVDARIRHTFGYLPEERGLYPKMRVRNQLEFFGIMHGMERAAARKRVAELADEFKLGDLIDKTPGELSKGNQQKVQFMSAIAHHPPLLVLDEPFAGLDPVNVEIFKSAIRKVRAEGTAILLSSHQMEQVEELCEDLCIIDRSSAVVQGNLADIKRNWPNRLVRITKMSDMGFLSGFPGVRLLPSEDGYAHLSVPQSLQPAELLRAAAAAGPLDHFELVEPSLNDIYLHYVKPEDEAA